MFLKYFRSNNLSLFFVNPILLLLAWIPAFTGSTEPVVPLYTTGITDSYFLEFAGRFPLMSGLIAIIIIAINGLLLVELNAQYFFIPVRGLLPGLIYALICSAIPELSNLTPALVSSTLVIIVLYRVLATFRQENLSYNYFDAGILIAAAGILYMPALFFYSVLLIALGILRPYQWREWAFTLIGFTVPFIFLFSYFYLTDRSIQMLAEGFTGLFNRSGNEELSPFFGGFMLILGIIILTGSAYIIRIIGLMKIQSRKFFMIFLWIFIFSLLIYFVIPKVSYEMIYFIAIPVAFLAGNYFMQCRITWINNILFLLFVGSVYFLKYLQY